MSMFKIHIRFPDGAHIERAEWGKNRRDALKTIESIYGKAGKDFVVVV
jgi:hypothetical protein